MPGIEVIESETEYRILGKGEMDLTIGSEFDNALESGVASGKGVVVDLLKAAYIDSAILAALAKHGMALRDRGTRLTVIVVTDEHPDYVLKTVGFDGIMDIVQESRGAETSA